MTDVTIHRLNFTDLTDDGEPDPLSTAILDLCCSAARLVQSPVEHMGAVTSLTALRDTLAAGLPETATLVTAVLDLIELSVDLTKENDNDHQ